MTDADQKTPLLQQQQHKPPVSRPKYRRRRSSFDPSTYNSTGQSLPYVKPSQLETTDPGLSLLQILGLTICMAGVQFTCKFFFFLLNFLFISFYWIIKFMLIITIIYSRDR